MPRPPRLATLLAVAGTVVLLTGAEGAARAGDAPQQAAIHLSADASPEAIVRAGDGSLWYADGYRGLKRLVDGKIVRSIAVNVTSLAAASPDTTVWFQGEDGVGHARANGNVVWVGVAGPTELVAAPDGSIWMSDDTHSQLDRLDDAGVDRRISVRLASPHDVLDQLAAGPDGALWFTEAGPVPAVGRTSPGGPTRLWRLPKGTSVDDLAVSSDDAWFTEPDTSAIGRVSASGRVRLFPAPNGLHPEQIVAGADGAAWYVADSCIGRISADGTRTAWPVDDARKLDGIAAEPDGSFWIADDAGHALRHFMPPADDAPAARTCLPPSVVRATRHTRATLSFHVEDVYGKAVYFDDPRLTIVRDGRPSFSGLLGSPKAAAAALGPDLSPEGVTNDFLVRDLDGDGEPEVIVTLDWGGTHCCTWSQIYRWDPARRVYASLTQFWGNFSSTPSLHDLDGDGAPELVGRDDRFAYDFNGYAGSVTPLRIWRYRHGRVEDVTRRFPNQVRADAGRLWALYGKAAKQDAAGIFPAWAADELLLGDRAGVVSALASALRSGVLLRSCVGCDPQAHGVDYVRQVTALLRKTGYLSREAVLQ